MKKHDWNKIKILYVEGINNDGKTTFPSFRELSEQCSVNYSYLKHRAAQEKWTQQRDIYSTKLSLKRLQKKSGLLASEGAEFDSKTLELAKVGILQIKAHFLAHKKMMKKAKREKKNIPLLDPKILDNLSRALVAFQKVGKLALSEQLPPEQTQSKEVLEFRREEKKLTSEQRAQLIKFAIKAEKDFMKSNKDINNGDGKH
ncbi:hypothetical protein ES702_07539 [subsurface metagenome]